MSWPPDLSPVGDDEAMEPSLPGRRVDDGRIGRRALLVGATGATALGTAGVALGVPGVRHKLRTLSRPDPVPPHAIPRGPTGSVVTGSFASAAMGRAIGWSVAYPAGSAPGTALSMLLVLHGRGDDHRAVLGGHALGAYLSGAVRSGVPPYALVAVDGGDHSYWHRRSSGEDPQAMITAELLPVLTRRGLRTHRIGLAGWSMGGYGALLLAEHLGRARVAVVAVDSPALWTRAGDSAPGAFDGRGDFLAHDVIGQHAGLAGIPIRVTCGTSDPFLPGVRAFLRVVPGADQDLRPGAHNLAFWQYAAPAQLAFVGRHLAAA